MWGFHLGNTATQIQKLPHETYCLSLFCLKSRQGQSLPYFLKGHFQFAGKESEIQLASAERITGYNPKQINNTPGLRK